MSGILITSMIFDVPILKENTPVYEYEPGSWGPDEVRQRVSPQGDWFNSKMTD